MDKLWRQFKMSALRFNEIAMRIALLLLTFFCMPAFAQGKTGAQVYEAVCQECHGAGKLKAPIFGNTEQWRELIDEGLDDLVPMALNGIRAMPPKGGDLKLSDLEVARAVVFMANGSGGQFAAPKAADARRWRKLANTQAKPTVTQ
jgi:cytochrome c5